MYFRKQWKFFLFNIESLIIQIKMKNYESCSQLRWRQLKQSSLWKIGLDLVNFSSTA
jgi:hypothetical protein